MRPGHILSTMIALAALTGCGGAPIERYYSLEAIAPTSESSIGIGRRLSVGPVSVPNALDRPQMVWRIGPRQIVIADQSRWTEHLPTSIGRVVADNLARQAKDIMPVSPQADADIRVELDIRRLDVEPGRQVVLDVVWLIRRSGGAKHGHSLKQENIASDTIDDLVAAHERALLSLSRDIAAALQ